MASSSSSSSQSYFDLYPPGSSKYQPAIKIKQRKTRPSIDVNSSPTTTTTTTNNQTNKSLVNKLSRLSLKDRLLKSSNKSYKSDDERTLKSPISNHSLSALSPTSLPPLPKLDDQLLDSSTSDNILFPQSLGSLTYSSRQQTNSSTLRSRNRNRKLPEPLSLPKNQPFLSVSNDYLSPNCASPSNVYTSIRSISPKKHKPIPFPISPPSPSTIERETDGDSNRSSIDLFAGPRTSLQFDPKTGELLSAGNDVSDMDALVSTLGDSALPPELRNMRRETKERGKLLALRDQVETEQRYNRKKKSNQNNNKNKNKEDQIKRSNELVPVIEEVTPYRRHRFHSSASISTSTSTSKKTSSISNLISNNEIGSNQTKTFSTLPRSSSLQLNRLMLDNEGIQPLPPPPIPEYYKKLSTTEDTKIPTIAEIVARYAIPSHRSAIPLTSKANRSIDEIVRDYPSLTSNSNTPEKISNIPLSTTINKCPHEREDSSNSSADSIAKEALRTLSTFNSTGSIAEDYFNQSSTLSPSIRSISPTNQLDREKSKTCRSAPTEPFTPRTSNSKTSKRSTGPDPSPSISDTDERIATYLQSPRLTTLIRLKNPPNERMTVSLADVGLSTGHPVIVFLGLGCVRYLVGLYDELATVLGLRLVCIDRWGLGKTSTVSDQDRGFLEWSTIVEEVANQLNLEKFSILAHSAGAPYALASSLRLEPRVKGSIHLLAPWVSMTADGGVNSSGYKWLKYLPNSMIKTAQAAEWKVQGWRLGKPPSLNRSPVGYDINAPISSDQYFGNHSNTDEEDRPSFESRLSDWSRISSDVQWLKNHDTLKLPSLPNFGLPPDNEDSKEFMNFESMIDNNENKHSHTTDQDQLHIPKPKSTPSKGLVLNKSHRSRTISTMSDKLGYKLPVTVPMTKTSSKPTPPTSTYPTLGLSLLRASYSESLKGGTSDLMQILERNSKPWGFSYKDIYLPVKIWHGDRDDKINLSASKWMENSMENCLVYIVKGADHSLMTNVNVMIEVFESIKNDWVIETF
ncbi:hypothetical protein CROQUDRAFT_136302 [Cronartium quercuum f. sp. fusiforme G11]|uniref:AB hydrolase-1 domain-containing protein n=1 Tax=Cronartium quercuum f. sp. fusiforme G11 TaxID=708437 RepID=A0A9P6T6R9_9BASI|nr:hypothetical protein CROQUDRAFT_136302 [Cronartium quercuum f. sp. fusiforme G11]